MPHTIASNSCECKRNLPKMAKASKTCTMRPVDTIGKRIARHRLLKGWSRPELGRLMAASIAREKPFSGEAVRRYEEGLDEPGNDARKALAAVFGKSELYIEFGDSPVRNSTTDADAFWNAYIAAPDHERKIIESLLKRHMKKK